VSSWRGWVPPRPPFLTIGCRPVPLPPEFSFPAPFVSANVVCSGAGARIFDSVGDPDLRIFFFIVPFSGCPCRVISLYYRLARGLAASRSCHCFLSLGAIGIFQRPLRALWLLLLFYVCRANIFHFPALGAIVTRLFLLGFCFPSEPLLSGRAPSVFSVPPSSASWKKSFSRTVILGKEIVAFLRLVCDLSGESSPVNYEQILLVAVSFLVLPNA